MKHYNIESVDGITFPEEVAGGELRNVVLGNDNAIARYDATNSIQGTGITVDDSDNISGVNDLSIGGDLFIDGTTFIVHSGEVSTSDTIIYINDGEVGPGVTAGRAGIQVDRGSLPDYQFLFVEATETFRVGEIGSLQAVATREDVPIDNYIPYWDSTSKSFVTVGSIPISTVSIPAGTKMWFYADVAPAGWTLDDTIGDALLAVRSVSATYPVGGTQGGGWTITGLVDGTHVLTIAEMPSHRHAPDSPATKFICEDGSNEVGDTGNEFSRQSYTEYEGGDQGHSHGVTQDGTWRPKADVGIICSKDA